MYYDNLCQASHVHNRFDDFDPFSKSQESLKIYLYFPILNMGQELLLFLTVLLFIVFVLNHAGIIFCTAFF